MASNLDVLNALADDITSALLPYQPNTIQFPNTSPVAGVIPNTVTGPGHPVQYPVTSTLEQGNAQVGIYFGKVTRPMPFISNRLYSAQGKTSGSVTNIFKETGRELKQLIVEVWAYTVEGRDAIANVVRGALGDAFRLSIATDSTTALLKWSGELEHDEEQSDSIWITQLFYMVDVTRTLLVGTQPDLGTGYVVVEVDTFVQPEDVQGNAAGPQVEVSVPNPSGDPNGT